MFKHLKNTNRIFEVFAMAMLFVACTPSMEKIAEMSTPSTPDQILTDVSIYYSREAKVEVRIKGSKVEGYEGADARMIFPKGVFCEFFNPDKTIKATLTAAYGRRDDHKQLIELRNNVIIIDHQKGDTMYCEQVFWDQQKHLIYSDKLVKRVQPSGISFGDGFQANESFDSIRIKKLRGVHNYEDHSAVKTEP